MPKGIALCNSGAAAARLSLNVPFSGVPGRRLDITRVFIARTPIAGEHEWPAFLQGAENADFADIFEAGIDHRAPGRMAAGLGGRNGGACGAGHGGNDG